MGGYSLPSSEVEPLLPMFIVTARHEATFSDESVEKYRGFIRRPGEGLSDDMEQGLRGFQLSVYYRFTGKRYPDRFVPTSISTRVPYERAEDKSLPAQILEIDSTVISGREFWSGPAQARLHSYRQSRSQFSGAIPSSHESSGDVLSDVSALRALYRRLAIDMDRLKAEKAELGERHEASRREVAALTMTNRLLKTQNASLKSESDKAQEESSELKVELLSLTLRFRDRLLDQSLLSKLEGNGSTDPSSL